MAQYYRSLLRPRLELSGVVSDSVKLHIIQKVARLDAKNNFNRVLRFEKIVGLGKQRQYDLPHLAKTKESLWRQRLILVKTLGVLFSVKTGQPAFDSIEEMVRSQKSTQFGLQRRTSVMPTMR